MSPIYTGDKLGFGVAPSAGGAGGVQIYNNAGMVFTNAGAYGNSGPTSTMLEYEYKDQKFWTENHYLAYKMEGTHNYAMNLIVPLMGIAPLLMVFVFKSDKKSKARKSWTRSTN